MSDDDDFCHGCDERPCVCEPDPEALDEQAERWTCIGADCINPHVTHMRDECFTVEMAKMQHEEEADISNEVADRILREAGIDHARELARVMERIDEIARAAAIRGDTRTHGDEGGEVRTARAETTGEG